MLLIRGILALAIAIVGLILLLRMAPLGLRLETLPGWVLGAAMVALGVHRLSLMIALRRGLPR